ncbi:MAG: hypothetical protein A4E19_13925 [Nitrospira sp. SG-bin1]|nr:MAG: hypothetical protein A4E19_13925 [Nitrospira sp. SG-bin1]
MKFSLTVMVMIAACSIFSACSLAQRAMPGATMSDADVVGVLNTVNRSEIHAGQLARDRASSSEVRAYASQMVNEHQLKMQNATQLARRIGVQPQQPALARTLENTHREAMEELREKSGRDFDKAYLEYQIKMHQQSVDLVENTVESVDHPELKRFLRETRPDLQKHLATAQSIQRNQ